MQKSEKKNRFSDCIDHNTSPNQEERNNPSKKSRTDELQSLETLAVEVIPSSSVKVCSVSNVQSQVISIASDNSHQVIKQFSRLDFINNQLINHFSASNLLPFVVHIESKSESENLRNLHPIKLSKLLADKFSSLSDIRRIRRGIISVKFKYRHKANSFVDCENLLPDNWIGYIPNLNYTGQEKLEE